MTKKRFNSIRSRLEMRLINQGNYNPENPTEDFVVDIIEAKHKLDKEVEEYEEENEYIRAGAEMERYLSQLL